MILVTGGLGFIGSHVAGKLVASGNDVLLTQYHSARGPSFPDGPDPARISIETVNVSNLIELCDLFSRHRFSAVIHLAFPSASENSFSRHLSPDLVGLTNILEASRLFSVPRVVVASSIAVYAGLGPGPYVEEARLPIAARTHISGYKKVVEQLGVLFAEQTDVEVVIARISEIYGPRYRSMRNLPSKVCAAIATGEWTDHGGIARRAFSDFCHVGDCAQGLTLLTLAGSLSGRIYNIGAGSGVSANEVVEAALSLGLPDDYAAKVKDQGPEDMSTYMSTDLANRDLGYAPRYDLRSGLAAYVDALRRDEG